MTSSKSEDPGNKNNKESSDANSQVTPSEPGSEPVHGPASIIPGGLPHQSVVQNTVPNNQSTSITPEETRVRNDSAKGKGSKFTRVCKPTDSPQISLVQKFITQIIAKQPASNDNCDTAPSSSRKHASRTRLNPVNKSKAKAKSVARKKDVHKDKASNRNSSRKTKEKCTVPKGQKKGLKIKGISSAVAPAGKSSKAPNEDFRKKEKSISSKSNLVTNSTVQNLPKSTNSPNRRLGGTGTPLRNTNPMVASISSPEDQIGSRIVREQDSIIITMSETRERNLSYISKCFISAILADISNSQKRKTLVQVNANMNSSTKNRLTTHGNHQLPSSIENCSSPVNGIMPNPIPKSNVDALVTDIREDTNKTLQFSVAPSLEIRTNASEPTEVPISVHNQVPNPRKPVVTPNQNTRQGSHQNNKTDTNCITNPKKIIHKRANNKLKGKKVEFIILSKGKHQSDNGRIVKKQQKNQTNQIPSPPESTPANIYNADRNCPEQNSVPMEVDTPMEDPPAKDSQPTDESHTEGHPHTTIDSPACDAEAHRISLKTHLPTGTEMQSRTKSPRNSPNFDCPMNSAPTCQNVDQVPHSSSNLHGLPASISNHQLHSKKSIELIPQLGYGISEPTSLRYYEVGQENSPSVGQKSIAGNEPIAKTIPPSLHKGGHLKSAVIPDKKLNGRSPTKRVSPRAAVKAENHNPSPRSTRGTRNASASQKSKKTDLAISNTKDTLVADKKRPAPSSQPPVPSQNEVPPPKKRRISRREMKGLENAHQPIQGSRKRVPLCTTVEHRNNCAEVEDHEAISEGVSWTASDRKNSEVNASSHSKRKRKSQPEKETTQSKEENSNPQNLLHIGLEQPVNQESSAPESSRREKQDTMVNQKEPPVNHSSNALPTTRDLPETENAMQPIDSNFGVQTKLQDPSSSVLERTINIPTQAFIQHPERNSSSKNVVVGQPQAHLHDRPLMDRLNIVNSLQNVVTFLQDFYGKPSSALSEMVDPVNAEKNRHPACGPIQSYQGNTNLVMERAPADGQTATQLPKPLLRSKITPSELPRTENPFSALNGTNYFENNRVQNNNQDEKYTRTRKWHNSQQANRSVLTSFPTSDIGHYSRGTIPLLSPPSQNAIESNIPQLPLRDTAREYSIAQMNNGMQMLPRNTISQSKSECQYNNTTKLFDSTTHRTNGLCSNQVPLSSPQQTRKLERPRKEVDVVLLPNDYRNVPQSFPDNFRRTVNSNGISANHQASSFSNKDVPQTIHFSHLNQLRGPNYDQSLMVVLEFLTFTVILENFLRIDNAESKEQEIVDGWQVQRLRDVLYFASISHKSFGSISTAKMHLCTGGYDFNVTTQWLYSRSDEERMSVFEKMGQQIPGLHYNHSDKLKRDISLLQGISDASHILQQKLSHTDRTFMSPSDWFHALMDNVYTNVFCN